MKTCPTQTPRANPSSRSPQPLERASILERAASPDTPPRTLLALSKTGDAEVTALIAANPNTPRKKLHKLWVLHPQCILENPILLYWSLREGIPTHALLPITVKVALYLELRRSGDTEALESHLPESERLRWLGRPLHKSTGASGIQNKSTLNGGCTEVYKTLATDPSANVRTNLAEQIDSIPFTPSEREEIQSILATDASPSIRRVLAGSRNINRVLHLRLATDPDFEVRCALASNPTIFGPRYLKGWNRLMAAGHAEQIAHNPGCPESLSLEILAGGSLDQKTHVWEGFRFHETTNWQAVNLAIEAVLADEARLPELAALARNQTLGGTLKGRLLHHPDVRVTRALATQVHLTEQQRLFLLFHPDHKTALRAAKHAPPADFLDIAAEHPSPWVRALLAKKPGEKTWSLRSKLVHDPDPRVRLALCRGLPEERSYNTAGDAVLKILKKTYPSDPSPRVRLVARKHPLLR
jgi:hypothetical protein